jgi:predicted NAD/FAD-binding protein
VVHTESRDIAVIGGGVAGITCAFLLQRHHRVTLYEKNDYFGGHTHTVVIADGPDAGTSVDTGFIVLNDRTYPLFNRLLGLLEVAIRESEMSFSYFCRRTGFQYASHSPNGIFAQRGNLTHPGFLYMLAEILRFNRSTRRRLRDGSLKGIRLGDYLGHLKFSRRFREHYIVPMAAAIWSSPDEDIARFPMETFARFFENHGLLSVRGQPRWYTVAGGSHTYVKAFQNRFAGRGMTRVPVKGLERSDAGVRVRLSDGSWHLHDLAVVATHADEALQMLEDPSPEERRLLGAWRYSRNRVVLHSDTRWMPTLSRAWASWNYMREPGGTGSSPISLTYHMNRLQKLNTRRPYFVTLNPVGAIPEEAVIGTFLYTHPTYSFESLATQESLRDLNAKRHTYYCGSYFGYGFHEDAVRSAADVAADIGVTL